MIRDPQSAVYHHDKNTRVVLDLSDRENDVVNLLYGVLPVFRDDEFKFEKDWDGMIKAADRWNWYTWSVKIGGLRYEFHRHPDGGRPSADVTLYIYRTQ